MTCICATVRLLLTLTVPPTVVKWTVALSAGIPPVDQFEAVVHSPSPLLPVHIVCPIAWDTKKAQTIALDILTNL
jgi:hypothetical protein